MYSLKSLINFSELEEKEGIVWELIDDLVDNSVVTIAVHNMILIVR